MKEKNESLRDRMGRSRREKKGQHTELMEILDLKTVLTVLRWFCSKCFRTQKTDNSQQNVSPTRQSEHIKKLNSQLLCLRPILFAKINRCTAVMMTQTILRENLIIQNTSRLDIWTKPIREADMPEVRFKKSSTNIWCFRRKQQHCIRKGQKRLPCLWLRPFCNIQTQQYSNPKGKPNFRIGFWWKEIIQKMKITILWWDRVWCKDLRAEAWSCADYDITKTKKCKSTMTCVRLPFAQHQNNHIFLSWKKPSVKSNRNGPTHHFSKRNRFLYFHHEEEKKRSPIQNARRVDICSCAVSRPLSKMLDT